jgi:hypothetical protein
MKSAGKALQQDVDNLITLFDVYDTLPLRPNRRSRNPQHPRGGADRFAGRRHIIATHIAATGMWLFCRRACLPRAASTANSCA